MGWIVFTIDGRKEKKKYKSNEIKKKQTHHPIYQSYLRRKLI